MDCRDVKNKLPYYLSDECRPEEKFEISKHLSICPECMMALDELDEPLFHNKENIKSLDTEKILSKARKALLLRVATTTIISIIMVVSVFFVIIPGIFKAVRYPKMADITRSLVDIVQFTSPSQVTGYGNSLAPFGRYSFKINVFTTQMTGMKSKDFGEIDREFNMITGTYESPVYPTMQYIHPLVEIPDEYLKEKSSEVAKNTLLKNGSSTTATVDISLSTTHSLQEIADALKLLDVRPLWMAVECGLEGQKPMKQLGTGHPVFQWGIPMGLYASDNPASFSYENVSDYEKAVIEELKWLDKNKKYITPDKRMLKFEGRNNAVGNRAKYIIDNGIKIYGLRVTGPSTELSKLGDVLDIRVEEVLDIDFYYWK